MQAILGYWPLYVTDILWLQKTSQGARCNRNTQTLISVPKTVSDTQLIADKLFLPLVKATQFKGNKPRVKRGM